MRGVFFFFRFGVVLIELIGDLSSRSCGKDESYSSCVAGQSLRGVDFEFRLGGRPRSTSLRSFDERARNACCNAVRVTEAQILVFTYTVRFEPNSLGLFRPGWVVAHINTNTTTQFFFTKKAT